jgi:hypothetical protein
MQRERHALAKTSTAPRGHGDTLIFSAAAITNP